MRLFAVLSVLVSVHGCYWNRECPYTLYSSKTPYDSIRGDIRDHSVPEHCEAISIWTLNRHGNRNPGGSVTEEVRHIAGLKDQIIDSFNRGTSQLCAQDIDLFKKWQWNSTLDVSQSFLTGTGYEELYDIASRLREKYPYLLQGAENEYYFRSTNEQRTITSAIAFVHGLSDGTNLNLTIDSVRERDDVIRPYENCDRYQKVVKQGSNIEEQLDNYYNTDEYIAVQKSVQQRLGILTPLSVANIYAFYELCRFDRSWKSPQQSPWCAVFTNEDLEVLEYRDDLRHYYRNGYGSWVNVNLGKTALKDMYETLESAVNSSQRKFTSYFTHDTMLEMVFCAMGMFKDSTPIQATDRDESRAWRTSFIGAFSTNLIAVLNRCTESGVQTHRVQLFINEKETEICPLSGCTWSEFQDRFQEHTDATLDFCSMEYFVPEEAAALTGNAADVSKGFFWVAMLQIVVNRLWN